MHICQPGGVHREAVPWRVQGVHRVCTEGGYLPRYVQGAYREGYIPTMVLGRHMYPGGIYPSCPGGDIPVLPRWVISLLPRWVISLLPRWVFVLPAPVGICPSCPGGLFPSQVGYSRLRGVIPVSEGKDWVKQAKRRRKGGKTRRKGGKTRRKGGEKEQK